MLFSVMWTKFISWISALPQSDRRLMRSGIFSVATVGGALWEAFRECLLHLKIGVSTADCKVYAHVAGFRMVSAHGVRKAGGYSISSIIGCAHICGCLLPQIFPLCACGCLRVHNGRTVAVRYALGVGRRCGQEVPVRRSTA